MTLPLSGTITMADLRTEFGLPATFTFPTDCYRGGAYVPNTPRNSAIPTSGTMILPTHFYGTSVSPEVTLPPTLAVYDEGYGAFGSASVSIIFESDGDIIESGTNSGVTDRGDWLAPKASAPSDYEIRATLVSGSVTSGTMNTWLALTSNRTWSRARIPVGTTECQVLFEIRKGAGAVLDSCTVTMTASRFE